MSSKAALDALAEPAGFRPAVLHRLWSQIPEGLRTLRLSSWRIPTEHVDAFTTPNSRAQYSFTLDLTTLPVTMGRELAWCVWQFIATGGKVPVSELQSLIRRLNEALDDMPVVPASLLDLTPQHWCQTLAATRARRTGKLPSATTRQVVESLLRRCYQTLWLVYDDRPWWQREIWGLQMDPRIPHRPHEPRASGRMHFHDLQSLWLRHGVQWYLKVGLETGALSWSTARAHRGGIGFLARFLQQQGIPAPSLCDDPDGLRPFMLDFLGYLRGLTAQCGPNRGQPLSQLRVTDIITDVEVFYLFMHDNREAAARALAEPGWLQLGPEHTVMWRRGEKQRPRVRPDLQYVIDDDAFSRIMANLHLLGGPEHDGGFDDEQVMRVVMLLARTGRRVSEILMLDREPLLALDRPAQPDPDGDGFVAKLRYQQTKIDKAPDTILVDAEVVAIIRAQQQWVDENLSVHWAAGVTPRYLFLGHKMNRHADRPLLVDRVRLKVTELAARLDIRDEAGRLVDFNRTHRFRHTKATSLLNAGVPLHVVQRYLGHLSPTMTMAYAQTLAQTHEREFLRYRKVTADARDLQVDPRDLYDMLELDKRTDRILPNGWCLLPPRQVCSKGNACLTCDKFATDASFLPELAAQQSRTEKLIGKRCHAFRVRTGQDIGEDNVWLVGRRQEQDALGRIILKLEQTRLADGKVQALRGAGVEARTDAIIGDQAGR